MWCGVVRWKRKSGEPIHKDHTHAHKRRRKEIRNRHRGCHHHDINIIIAHRAIAIATVTISLLLCASQKNFMFARVNTTNHIEMFSHEFDSLIRMLRIFEIAAIKFIASFC